MGNVIKERGKTCGKSPQASYQTCDRGPKPLYMACVFKPLHHHCPMLHSYLKFSSKLSIFSQVFKIDNCMRLNLIRK